LSLQNNRNSDLRPSIFLKLLLIMSKNMKSQNEWSDFEQWSFRGSKKIKMSWIFEVETSPALTPYYSIRAQELALRVIIFKQLGVSPHSGMVWLRFGIKKSNFHHFSINLKKYIFDPFLKKFGGQTFSLQNNRNSDLRPSIFRKLLLTIGKNIKSQNDCQDSELWSFWGSKKIKMSWIFEVETSPALTPYYSIRAQELALRVIIFKQLASAHTLGWFGFELASKNQIFIIFQ
jgi:hypothetical protein